MIIRMWHGRVHHDNAHAYRELLKQRAIPDYQPEDDGYLLEFEPTVVHYEIFGQS